jgi:glyoxylase-like metal-dependent hydrolase (beta-lactamase superfamily II)
MRTGHVLAVATLAVCTAACSSQTTTQELAQRNLSAMGGADRIRAIQSLVMKGGTGSRSRLGQSVKAGDTEPPAKLTNVEEAIDLMTGRVALTYELTTGAGFTQKRQEILTRSGDRLIGLENVGGRPLAVMSPSALFSWGTQNSPSMTQRRNVIAIALAAIAADPSQIAGNRGLGMKTFKFGKVPIGGETIGVYFDSSTELIAAYETTDTETILGDVTSLYRLEDYRNVGGILLPHKITIEKAGEHYADVQFTSAVINDPASLQVFDIPYAANGAVEAALAQGNDYSPLALTPIGKGVYFAQAYSHHSLVVEFPSYLAVVEAPYTEAQSRTLVKQLTARFPRKPIKYAAVTHPHYDHIGGVRGLAAAGATILVARKHEAPLKALLSARHTNPADELDTRRQTGASIGSIELYDDAKVLSEGGQSLQLFAVSGSPHAEPIVLAFVPGAGVLFQSDLFFPGTGAAASPAATHLLQAVRQLDLRVAVNAGGHGGVAPFSELVNAAGNRTN